MDRQVDILRGKNILFILAELVLKLVQGNSGSQEILRNTD